MTEMEVDGGAGMDGCTPMKQMRTNHTCVMGCAVDVEKPVYLLTCLHVICSDRCLSAVKANSKSKGTAAASLCHQRMVPENIKSKVILKDIFVRKTPVKEVELICENCVWNRPAAAYCPECPACLCTPCKELHPQTRATQKHQILDNLEDYKAQEQKKIAEEGLKCKTHGERLVVYCDKCCVLICKKCVLAHGSHQTIFIEEAKKKLQAKMVVGKQLRESLFKAQDDIGKKREDIITTEWNNMKDQINEHFTAMVAVLIRRQEELQKEAKDRFTKQLAALNMRRKCVEVSKVTLDRFIETADDVLNNCEDVASHKFLRGCTGTFEWLNDMDNHVTKEYARFVDKDYHFNLNLVGLEEAQKYMKEYGQVEYVCNPNSFSRGAQLRKPQLKTYPPKPRIVEAKSQIVINPVHVSPTKRKSVAMKSTGAPQLSVNKLNALKTYSRRSGNDQPGTFSVSTKPVDLGKGDSNMRARSGKKLSSPSDRDIVTVTLDGEKNSISTLVTNVVPDANSKLVPMSESNAASKPSNPNDSKCEESSSDCETMPVLEANAEAPLESENNSANVKPDDTSGSAIEFGVGKRERKRKAFPEFVDTDESLKFLNRSMQESSSAVSTRTRRKSCSSATRGQGFSSKSKGDGSFKEDNEMETFSVEVEKDNDYESDGGSSEGSSVARRKSLRKRATPAPPLPDTPEGPDSKRKSRGNRDVEHLNFPDAPLESMEEAPEMCDFPVQGVGKMKFSTVDENEDYCSICMDGGDDVIVCCDFCPKVFHLECHIPVIREIPEGDAKWKCTYDTTKESILQKMTELPDDAAESRSRELVEGNDREFPLACKFVMECFKIPEIPTMRWVFPQGYSQKFNKIPFHMRYIRERLCLRKPTPFENVTELMLAFRQMFLQAFVFYKKKPTLRNHAMSCFNQFKSLLNEYYPEHASTFEDVLPAQ